MVRSLCNISQAKKAKYSISHLSETLLLMCTGIWFFLPFLKDSAFFPWYFCRYRSSSLCFCQRVSTFLLIKLKHDMLKHDIHSDNISTHCVQVMGRLCIFIALITDYAGIYINVHVFAVTIIFYVCSQCALAFALQKGKLLNQCIHRS